MWGSAAPELFQGLVGNDTLIGRESANTLLGGHDDDFLTGGSGNGSLNGQRGNALLSGDGGGTDCLARGRGDGTLYSERRDLIRVFAEAAASGGAGDAGSSSKPVGKCPLVDAPTVWIWLLTRELGHDSRDFDPGADNLVVPILTQKGLADPKVGHLPGGMMRAAAEGPEIALADRIFAVLTGRTQLQRIERPVCDQYPVCHVRWDRQRGCGFLYRFYLPHFQQVGCAR